MTVLNNMEIEALYFKRNEIKDAIRNNDPIEDKLNVIIVISNPCLYAKRYLLANQFKKRMEEEENIILYIVELAYGDQKYYITDENNKNHLRIKTNVPLWHKENMINIGVKKLLPSNWKAFAWIDADIEFENNNWAVDTLKILNGSKDIVQLFSHAVDLDSDEFSMSVFNSFGYQYVKKKIYCSTGINYWHPGYAWACTRKLYERIGGLFQFSILGSGDHNMALSILNNGLKSVNKDVTDNYKKMILEFQKKIKNARLGYVPGVIRHYYHGSKKNRQYTERWKILVNNNYDPINHVTFDKNGIIIPSKNFPEKLKKEIFMYFKERNEDEK
jgi:hypothetical protein